jgi:HAD superfamily hydrolase (TIGR01484 family)
MKSKRKFKAIICDIDGTLIANNFTAMPSEKVKQTIKKAQRKIHICLATSRPLHVAQHLIDNLNVSSLCVLIGGAQLYDPRSKKTIWEKRINTTDVKKIFEIANAFDIKFTDDGTGKNLKNENILIENYLTEGPHQFWVYTLSPRRAEKFVNALSKIKTIAAAKIPSWEKGRTGVLITHKFATKKHGIQKLSKLLLLKPSEMIGIGDGQNDLPLLTSCGFKVAMGNAEPELKAIADYIAPSVEDDGIVDVIEKFIL